MIAGYPDASFQPVHNRFFIAFLLLMRAAAKYRPTVLAITHIRGFLSVHFHLGRPLEIMRILDFHIHCLVPLAKSISAERHITL